MIVKELSREKLRAQSAYEIKIPAITILPVIQILFSLQICNNQVLFPRGLREAFDNLMKVIIILLFPRKSIKIAPKRTKQLCANYNLFLY